MMRFFYRLLSAARPYTCTQGKPYLQVRGTYRPVRPFLLGIYTVAVQIPSVCNSKKKIKVCVTFVLVKFENYTLLGFGEVLFNSISCAISVAVFD